MKNKGKIELRIKLGHIINSAAHRYTTTAHAKHCAFDIRPCVLAFYLQVLF